MLTLDILIEDKVEAFVMRNSARKRSCPINLKADHSVFRYAEIARATPIPGNGSCRKCKIIDGRACGVCNGIEIVPISEAWLFCASKLRIKEAGVRLVTSGCGP